MQEPANFAGGAVDEESSMPQGRQLARVADAVARWTVYLAVFLVPLTYLPWTVNGLDFNKQALVIVLAIVGTLAWLAKMLVSRKVEWRRSPMNLLIGIYLVIYFVSAWFSKNRYLSYVGDYGQEAYGAVTAVSFALIYLVAINTFKGAKDVKKALHLLLLAGFIIIVLAYLQVLGLRFFGGQAGNSSAFNLIGSVNALGVYSGFMLALLMGVYLMPEKRPKWNLVRNVILGILGVLALLYVAMLSFWVIWLVVVASAVVILAYGMVKTDKVSLVTMLSIPMALIVIGVLFMFLRFPINIGLPAEVLPSLRASANISKDALANAPLLGSGPGTFLFDYTQFRSADLNATAFWNVHFDRSASSFLTLLATTGILGIAAWLVLFGFFGARVGIGLAKGREDWLLRLTMFAGWVALFVGKLLYSTNMSLEFLFWMMTALLVTMEWNTWREAKFEQSPRSALVLSFFFIVAVIFSIAGLYLEGQRYVAERAYTKAATAQITSEADVDAAIQNLARATQLNGQNDLYYRTLSQALRLKVNIEAQKAGANPTAEQARNLAVLTANTVNTGKRATDLSPSNVQNWSSLAGMYRDLAGTTEGAAEAAESAYLTATELEPANPIYHTELGKVRLNLADALAATVETLPEEEKVAAQERIAELEGQAADNFNKAVELKGDYGAAHYWVAISLQREGRTAEALERLAALRQAAPDDLGVGLQYGILLYQSGQQDDAIAELERLIGLSPNFSNARWFLSAMYEENGRLSDAIAQIEEVAKFNPGNANIEARLAALKGETRAPAPEEGLPEPIEEQPEGEVIPAP